MFNRTTVAKVFATAACTVAIALLITRAADEPFGSNLTPVTLAAVVQPAAPAPKLSTRSIRQTSLPSSVQMNKSPRLDHTHRTNVSPAKTLVRVATATATAVPEIAVPASLSAGAIVMIVGNPFSYIYQK
jgi:hypothetical protein